MKKTFTCLFLLITSLLLKAQSDGISYQAFIANPVIQEVPGPDIIGTALSNKVVEVRFTITDENNSVEYQEIQSTTTDNHGIINLTIGKGNAIQGIFTDIKWYGESKKLKVEVNISHKGFKELSNQELLFTPFAYHRDIYAKGFLEVDKQSTFKDDATFNKNVTINENFRVDKNSTFKDDATFNKNVTINENLQVDKNSTFKDDATFNKNVTINENLQVDKNSTFKDDATFNKNVTINENLQVDKNSTFKDDATFKKNVTINENLQVDKNSTFKDDATFNKNVTINENLQVDKNSTFKDDATFKKNVTINENLQVDKNSTFKDDATLNKNVTINEKLQVDKNSTFKDDATFKKNVTINENLQVDKKSTFKDDVTFEKQSSFERNVVIKGRTVFNSETFENKDNSETGTGKGDENINNYPVLIEGSKQGLAIKVKPAKKTENSSDRGNNYISFWNGNTQTGRIEGMGKYDREFSLKHQELINGIYDIILKSYKGEFNKVFDKDIIANQTLSIFKKFITFDGGRLPNIDLGDIKGLIKFNKGSLIKVNVSKFKVEDSGSLPSLSFNDNNLPKINDYGKLPKISFNLPEIPDFSDPKSVFSKTFTLVEKIEENLRETIDSQLETALNNVIFPLTGKSSDPEFKSIVYSNHFLNEISFAIDIVDKIANIVISMKASTLDVSSIPKALWSLGTSMGNLSLYEHYTKQNIGCAFESGAGDYAEWLIRANQNELITAGDVVGVIGGKVSKTFNHADKFMVVSTAPIVLGNMPNNPEENHKWEKVAFMGQVPVKIIGGANIGDYILPSGNGDGMAIAVNPKEMLSKDYQRIVGVAWQEADSSSLFNTINVAVGINHNDTGRMLSQMQVTLNHIQKTLVKLDSSYETQEYIIDREGFQKQSMDYTVAISHPSKTNSHNKHFSNKAKAITHIKQSLLKQGFDVEKYPIIKCILDNPDKADYMSKILPIISSGLKHKLEGVSSKRS